mmetsp:Transcript_23663/g.35809  ORF Transcript_23663/g.35809 Transcript_23663/m.35809 type:complete len:87 (-) Transcript_23663:1935-2195(-)
MRDPSCSCTIVRVSRVPHFGILRSQKDVTLRPTETAKEKENYWSNNWLHEAKCDAIDLLHWVRPLMDLQFISVAKSLVITTYCTTT